METLINSLPFWISARDVKGQFLVMNESMGAVYGISPGIHNDLGNDEALKTGNNSLDDIFKIGKRVVRSGKMVESREVRVIYEDGKEEKRRVVKMPYADESGRVLGVISWSEDITKRVIAEEELALRIQELAYSADMVNELNESLNVRNAIIEEDLRVAAEFQQGVYSDMVRVPFLKSVKAFRPHSQVSGDMYNLAIRVEGHLDIFVGDATGHGITAAFMTMVVQTGLDSLDPAVNTAAGMAALNNQLAAKNLDGKFMTGAFVRIAGNGCLRATLAGHPPLIIFPQNGAKPVHLKETGFSLGWFDSNIAQYTELTYSLNPGDRILIYTDGILEWANWKGEQYGLERMLAVAQQHSENDLETMMARVMEDVESFSEGKPCDDDLCLFTLEYTGPESA